MSALSKLGYAFVAPGWAMAGRWYSIREAAARLNVSHDTVSHSIDRGELPAIRVSERLVRIPAPALDRYESGLTVAPRRPPRTPRHRPAPARRGRRRRDRGRRRGGPELRALNQHHRHRGAAQDQWNPAAWRPSSSRVKLLPWRRCQGRLPLQGPLAVGIAGPSRISNVSTRMVATIAGRYGMPSR